MKRVIKKKTGVDYGEIDYYTANPKFLLSEVKTIIAQSDDIIEICDEIIDYFKELRNEEYMTKFYFDRSSAPSWWICEEETTYVYECFEDFYKKLVDVMVKERLKDPKEFSWSVSMEFAVKYFMFNSRIKEEETEFQKKFYNNLDTLLTTVMSDKESIENHLFLTRFKIIDIYNDAIEYWKFSEKGPGLHKLDNSYLNANSSFA